MVTAYLALGSNLGNRLAFLRGGRDALSGHAGIELVKASGVYETEAVGGPPDNPPFLNAVVEVATTLGPRDLLLACLAIEDDFGRTRPAEWTPRTLDIDLLFYADQVIEEPDLVIPHPRLHERAFVLAPLLEIAGEVAHPQLAKTVVELAAGNQEIDRLQQGRISW